jgi:hypothetical protein
LFSTTFKRIFNINFRLWGEGVSDMLDSNQMGPVKPNAPHNPYNTPKANRATPTKKFNEVLSNVDSRDKNSGEVDSPDKNSGEVDDKNETRDTSHSVFDLSAGKSKPKAPKMPISTDPDAEQASLLDNEQIPDQAALTGKLVRNRQFEIPAAPLTDDEAMALNPNPQLPKKLVGMPETPNLVVKPKLEQSALESDILTSFATEEQDDVPTEDSTGKTGSIFSQEKPDLAYVNPVHTQSLSVENKTQAPLPVSRPEMQVLVDRIVEAMRVIQHEGTTQTVVDLRNPPILAGAQLTLTTNDAARAEFQIAFSNLSTDGKLLLDQHIMKDNLKANLENQGFVIHTITTDTTTMRADTSQSRQFSRDEDAPGQQQQQQRRNRNNPDDTA